MVTRTKIVCTIGPASDSVVILKKLIQAGMDVCRLNFSHGSHPDHRERFERIIKWLLHKHSMDNNNTRFTDKSQVFTVKVSLINALLTEYNPYFLLITRDPYASCYRATKGIQPDVKKFTDKFGLNSGLRIASQHWTNSMKFALKDSKEVKNFMVSRFEDILKYPIKVKIFYYCFTECLWSSSPCDCV